MQTAVLDTVRTVLVQYCYFCTVPSIGIKEMSEEFRHDPVSNSTLSTSTLALTVRFSVEIALQIKHRRLY